MDGPGEGRRRVDLRNDGSEEPVPDVNGKGRLIWQLQDFEDGWEDGHHIAYPRVFYVAIALAFFAATIPIFGDMDTEMGSLYNLVASMIAILGAIPLLVGVVRHPMEVLKVYENGVLVGVWNGSRLFLSWGHFKRSDELLNKKDMNLSGLRLRGSLGMVFILPNEQYPDGFIERVKRQVNQPSCRFVDEEHVDLCRRGLLRAMGQWLFWTLVLVIGATAVYLVAVMPGAVLVAPVLILLGLCAGSMCVLPFFIDWLFRVDRVEVCRLDARSWATLCVILLVLTFGGFGAGYSSWYEEYPLGEFHIAVDTDPGFTSLAPDRYVEEHLTASGPVVVGPGETLELVRSTLEFNPSPGLDWGLWVDEGGNLIMDNSTLVPADRAVGLSIEIHGSAMIVHSRIVAPAIGRTTWDEETGDALNDYGFEIFSDEVFLYGTTVEDAPTTGVILYNCSPQVEGCRFQHIGQSAIVVRYGDPRIANTTFIDCERGLNLFDSGAMITNCTIRGSFTPITMYNSAPVIEGCMIIGSEYEAIRAVESAPVISNTSFRHIGGSDVREYTWDSFEMERFLLVPIMVYTFPIFLLCWAALRLSGQRLARWREARAASKDTVG